MKILLIILILMTNSILCGNPGNEGIKIHLYKNGKKTVVKLSSSDKTELLNIVEKLFNDADDQYRLYVDPERAESIKKDDKALEILFDKETSLSTKNQGTYNLDRLLIPLSGDLFVYPGDKKIIFLTGNPDYSGSPLVSDCDKLTFEKLMKLIDN